MHMLSPRQIHLDFHTSELIPEVGAAFDAEKFAQTMADAHVSSVTVFARGHHGWMYYDSKKFPERVHPTLTNKNLVVDQVRALHARGIRAPLYVTVQWDYYTARNYPEWLARNLAGSLVGNSFAEAGFYQTLCVNTGYRDFLKAHVKELIDLFGDELDGFFFDIVGVRPCTCSVCRKMMTARGLDFSDEQDLLVFTKDSLDDFQKDMSAFIRNYREDCTIFYNAGHIGPCVKKTEDTYSHFELESLPSGGWGYLHFPTAARYARKLSLDCMGMTGKFHTAWGDFHSLKNQAALEFEAFRMLSYGFACSIGDQLEPCGKLGAATYRLIGNVFGQYEQYEPWGRPAKAITEAAVYTAESPLSTGGLSDEILGACQMLEELALQFDILDREMSPEGYKLVIIPENFRGDEQFAAMIDAYVKNGGKVIACGRGGADDEGKYPACFGVTCKGDNELYPDFILGNSPMATGLDEEGEYAIYMQGVQLESDTATPVLNAVAPYFARNAKHFCSHSYTPSTHGEAYPVAYENNGVIVFGHPMFGQYRANAPRWVKTLMGNAIDRLLDKAMVRHDGASTVSVTVLDQPQQGRKCVHILTYIPVRKSATIDIVEERTKVRDLTLTLNVPGGFTKARLVPCGTELPVCGNSITVPEVDGYAIVELT